MSVVAAAVIGSSVVGAVVSKKASDKAVEASQEANDASLAFDRERYQDWQDTYGGIEDNLADYYGNLTPEYYEALGLETFQKEFDTNMERLNESLAQRGITDSGISASLEMQSELGAAEQRAEIRRDSETIVNQEKSRFLQIGLGQNPGQSMSNTLANQASEATNFARQSQVAAGQAIGNAVGTVGTAIADYARRPKTGGLK